MKFLYWVFMRVAQSTRGLAAVKLKSLLNKARALNRMVTIDQLDAETLGLRVDHQRIARRQFHERIAPRLLVEMRARHVEHRLATIHRLSHQLAHYPLAQAREQHE